VIELRSWPVVASRPVREDATIGFQVAASGRDSDGCGAEAGADLSGQVEEALAGENPGG